MRNNKMQWARSKRWLVLAAFAAASFPASAQNAAPNLDKFVITGDAAKRAKTRTEISGDTAEKLAKACEAYAKEKHVSVAIFIVSPSGAVVHSHRMDGLGPINVETAQRKALTALYVRGATSIYEKRYDTDLQAEVARVMLDKYWVSGGLPIIVDDQLIGAIGVGGSRDDDENCAYAALTKVLGPQPPLPTTDNVPPRKKQ